MGFEGILTCTIAMWGSFGPVVALSSLSNNLNQTLASGERVLSLLEETPLVEEIPETGKSIVSVTDRSAGSAENDDATEQNLQVRQIKIVNCWRKCRTCNFCI